MLSAKRERLIRPGQVWEGGVSEKGGFGVDGLGWYPVPLVDEESAGRGVELGVHSVALKPPG